MDQSEISLLRLRMQRLTEPCESPVKVAEWMGALQAQDYNMVKWALGLRSRNASYEAVQKALDCGDLIRTHLLRPTWHIVAASNLDWMLELTAPQIKASLGSRHRQLELDEKTISQSLQVMESVLTGGKALTREDLASELEESGIVTTGQRMPHLLLCAELEGLLCSGPDRGKKATYALLRERTKKKKDRLDREESLVRLTALYFSSHGPATLQDFVWWSGLPVADARKGLEATKATFRSTSVDGETYWYSNQVTETGRPTDALLLPAFDEFIISYKDRKAVLSADHHKKAVSDNGIFRPTVVSAGKVVGLWKREVKKNEVLVETQPFHDWDRTLQSRIQKAITVYKGFLPEKT